MVAWAKSGKHTEPDNSYYYCYNIAIGENRLLSLNQDFQSHWKCSSISRPYQCEKWWDDRVYKVPCLNDASIFRDIRHAVGDTHHKNWDNYKNVINCVNKYWLWYGSVHTKVYFKLWLDIYISVRSYANPYNFPYPN